MAASRQVDASVLTELAARTRDTRARLNDEYQACRSVVQSAPGGWNAGEWDGTTTFIRLELEQLDREAKELTERAWKAQIAAAIAGLEATLPLMVWKFLMTTIPPVGFVLGTDPGAALDLVQGVAKFVQGFGQGDDKRPTVGALGVFLSSSGLAGGGALKLEQNGTGQGPSGVSIVPGDKPASAPGGAPLVASALEIPLLPESERAAAVNRIYEEHGRAGLVPTQFSPTDCVSFAGAVFLAAGLPVSAIPGRGGPSVYTESYGGEEGFLQAWKNAGWTPSVEPRAGAFIQVDRPGKDQHAAVFLGMTSDGRAVIEESNYSWGGSKALPLLRAIDAAGYPHELTSLPEMTASGSGAAEALRRYYDPKHTSTLRFFVR